ncbi:hypothetical protein PM082_014549 [Marasmius tenuissimus]|nr:hypothetical protein PM082_014549 [Marasmius tenuissimus]
MPPRKTVVKPTDKATPGMSPRASKVPGSSTDGLKMDLGISPIAPDAEAELRAPLHDVGSASGNMNPEVVELGLGNEAPEKDADDSEYGDDRLPAIVKGKGKLPAEDDRHDYNEPDDANIELQGQIMADIEFQKELKLRDNENLYEEFLKWREEFAKPYSSPAKLPSVKIEEILDEEATPAQIRQFEAKRASEAVVSDVMADRIAKLANTNRAKSERPIDYVDRDSAMGRMLYSEPVAPRYSNGRLNIKPIPPTKYKGEMSTRTLMKFFRETRRYMIDGNIPEDRQVDIVTSFVEGNLSTYLERLIRDEPEKWSLQEVFIRIYNHVFPLNYRLEQRKKLKNARQNGRRVREYIDYVEELFDTIGNVDDGSKVTTMWDGFDAIIQKGLYLKGLHPEKSTLNAVTEAAEVVELIEGTHRESRSSRRDRRNGNGKNDEERRAAFSVEFQQGTSKFPSNFKDRKDGNKFRKNGRTLTEAQKNEYRANNQCFSCGQVGHKSRDCPKNTTVKGDKKANTPPELSSHNLEFELPETMDIIETTVEEVALNVVNFDWFEDVEYTYYSDSDSESWQNRPSNEEDLEDDHETNKHHSCNSKCGADDSPDDGSILRVLLDEGYDSEKENIAPDQISLAPSLADLWAAYALLNLKTYGAPPAVLEPMANELPKCNNPVHRCYQLTELDVDCQVPAPRKLIPEEYTFEGDLMRNREHVQSIWKNEAAAVRDAKIKWSFTARKQGGLRTLDSSAWYLKEKDRRDTAKLEKIRSIPWNKDLFQLDSWVKRPNSSAQLTPFRGMGTQTYQIYRGRYQQFGYRHEKRPVKFGDPVAERVLELLNSTSYYGDHLFSRKDKQEAGDRFSVYRISDLQYVIIDGWWWTLDENQAEFILDEDTLRNEDFYPNIWLDNKHREWAGLEPVNHTREWRWRRMGDAYREELERVLNVHYCRFHFPGDDLPLPPKGKKRSGEWRFTVKKIGQGDSYLVIDKLRDLKFVIKTRMLRDPRLNFIRWLEKRYVEVMRTAYGFDMWTEDLSLVRVFRLDPSIRSQCL